MLGDTSPLLFCLAHKQIVLILKKEFLSLHSARDKSLHLQNDCNILLNYYNKNFEFLDLFNKINILSIVSLP